MTATLQGRTKKRWRFLPHDADRIAQLEQTAAVAPIVAQLLIGRGVYDGPAARNFLDAKLTGLRDPDLLPGAADAADRVYAAIKDGRKIVVYGDYDADGITGTALLLSCLKLLGADATYYVPNRLEEGYGLNSAALRSLRERGAALVVSVDCGIASLAEAALAREIGLELIVTDHHEFAASLPDAAAIVHPRLPGHSYPFGGLCGAGVALKLAWAICQRASQAKRVSEPMKNFLLQAVALAALGTVADVVPLVDENRALALLGLRRLAQTQ
jgi:single-stranded-DNA-specific exonuclease